MIRLIANIHFAPNHNAPYMPCPNRLNRYAASRHCSLNNTHIDILRLVV